MESLVSLFSAAYSRLQGSDAIAVVAALLNKPSTDIIVKALAIVFYIAQQDPGIPANNALDIAIAMAVDQEKQAGFQPSDISADDKQLADYLINSLPSLPQPIPRRLLQPFANALVDEGSQPTREAAIRILLSTYTFQ